MSVFQFFTIVYVLSVIGAAAFFVVRIIKGEPTKKLLISYLKILGIGTLSSLFPFLWFGLAFGFPSVLLASIVITYVFRKELA